ncbi:MAG: IS66 family transposase [Candidatus Dormibacteraceae bacterium]
MLAELSKLAARVKMLEIELGELKAENAELKRRLGINSHNSSTPPSKDTIAAKAALRANRSSRERSKDRNPGGQRGHEGSGLKRAETPDRIEELEPPECEGCGEKLVDGQDQGCSWSQVWDIPRLELERVEYLLRRRKCRGCGKTSTARPEFGIAGAVSYGANINAAAILLGSEGNVPLERTARLMEMLLGVRVSAGFVALAGERMANKLESAQFEQTMELALSAESVLCADETPVNVLRRDTDEDGAEIAGAPHVLTVRTPDQRLIWYAALQSRSSQSIAMATLGILEEYSGYLVRDDYAGWYQFDAQLAGVQQCAAHLIRHCRAQIDLDSLQQQWAADVIEVLRQVAAIVEKAKAEKLAYLDSDILARLRARYDAAVQLGIDSNRDRYWYKGNHPAYVLAKRLQLKAEQVWLFTQDFRVPWTNNASEQALREPKRHQVVSGYWHSSATLGAYLRLRSYLVSARAHGLNALDAIHSALLGNPWLPLPISN